MLPGPRGHAQPEHTVMVSPTAPAALRIAAHGLVLAPLSQPGRQPEERLIALPKPVETWEKEPRDTWLLSLFFPLGQSISFTPTCVPPGSLSSTGGTSERSSALQSASPRVQS